jgi:hypothetical protein
MTSSKKGWRTIKTLTSDEIRSIRIRELRLAAVIADTAEWSAYYTAKANEMEQSK